MPYSAAPSFGVLASCCSLVLMLAAARSAAAAPPRDDCAPDGAALFDRHCAVCHDSDGRARSAIAQRLLPRPRDFGEGLFQLSSAENGVPILPDIERVIARGLPGSAMPGFPGLDAAQRTALASHVVELSIDAIAARLVAEVASRGDELDGAEARKLAEWAMTPEEPAEPPPFPPADDASLARGRALYLVHCAACHGSDGGGRAVVEGFRDGEFPVARDLRVEPLKGGSSLVDLARRVRAGMPGRGMPPTLLEPDDLAALTVYVKSLVPDDVEERFTQRAASITARRVKKLPESGEASEWRGLERSRLVLTPLAARRGAVLEVEVAAAHDGDDLAVLLVWRDATRDDRAIGHAALPDAAAIQFATGDEPPVFGMGSAHDPTHLFAWRAFDAAGAASLFDLLESLRGLRGSGAATDADTQLPALPAGLLAPSREATSGAATGAGQLADAASGAPVTALPLHENGEWRLVLRRSLAASREGDLALAPGAKIRFACAIWNGAAGDHGLRKSISIWNELRLAD
jgi:mono/diheme cytochrome c family protein